MNKNTVKRRIFISNTLMILVTLGIFLIVNLGIIKVYSESIEHEFEDTAVELMGDDGLEEMVETWTIKRNEFIILFLADGILCILALVGVSQAFTRNLSRHILEPLDALNGWRRAGAE